MAAEAERARGRGAMEGREERNIAGRGGRGGGKRTGRICGSCSRRSCLKTRGIAPPRAGAPPRPPAPSSTNVAQTRRSLRGQSEGGSEEER